VYSVYRRRIDNQWPKGTKNDLQNITQKTKNRATRIQLKLVVNYVVPEGYAVPAPIVAPVVLLLLQTR